MKQIEIYYNRDGILTLIEYDDSKKHISGNYKNDGVTRYLENLNESKIKTVLNYEDGNKRVSYDDCYIDIKDFDKMIKDPFIENYIDKVFEKEDEMSLQRAYNVTRKPKYNGNPLIPIGIATTLLLSSLLGLASGGSEKSVTTDEPEETKIVQHEKTTPYDKIVDDAPFTDDITTRITFEESDYQIPITDTPYQNPTPETGPITTTQIPKTESIYTTNTPEVFIPNKEPEETFAYIDYEDRSETDKAIETKNKYDNVIKDYAEMYGLDPALVLAIATQERGTHSSTMDPGGATGLMQIQNSIWLGNELSAYNFKYGTEESYIVTQEKLGDLYWNVKFGCMILQNTIKQNDYNIIAGVQSYNMGCGSVNKVLAAYGDKTGLTKEEVLSDTTNCDWLDYRYIINKGDKQYIEHILSFMGSDINTFVYKPTGEKVELSVQNYQNIKSR